MLNQGTEKTYVFIFKSDRRLEGTIKKISKDWMIIKCNLQDKKSPTGWSHYEMKIRCNSLDYYRESVPTR